MGPDEDTLLARRKLAKAQEMVWTRARGFRPHLRPGEERVFCDDGKLPCGISTPYRV